MSEGPPYEVVATIFELERQNKLYEAYNLITKHTYNEQWASHVLEAIGPDSQSTPSQHRMWLEHATAKYNRKTNELRQKQQNAMVSQDLITLGQLYLEEGHLLTLRGLYRQAYRVYQSARSSNPSLDIVGLLSVSHLDILQQNWSLIETSIGKHLLFLKEKRDDFFLPLGANYALATWCLGKFPDCLAVLLHSEPCPVSPWIQKHNLCLILVLCALTSLERSAIGSSFLDDPVFAELAFPSARKLVELYLELDIPQFWELFNDLENQFGHEYFVAKSIEAAKSGVRRRMQYEWLSLHARCRLSQALRIFAYPIPPEQYDIFAFIEDLDGEKVHMDCIEDTLEIGVTSNDEVQIAENLAHEYISDSVMLHWANVVKRLKY